MRIVFISVFVWVFFLTCAPETGTTTRGHRSSIESTISEKKIDSGENVCLTVLRIKDDLGISHSESTAELHIRVDSQGQSTTVPVLLQESVQDVCLDIAISPGVRPNIHFHVDQHAPVNGRFSRGDWRFWGRVEDEVTPDGRRILVIPLSRFRYMDDFARTVAP
jgi:hypothetical protein